MNRMEILILNTKAEVYTRHVDVSSVMSFLQRVGRVGNFNIVVRKGAKALYIEKIEPATLIKQLTDFQNTPA